MSHSDNGGTIRDFAVMSDHSSATITRKGKIVGFGESHGRGRAASGDLVDSGMIEIAVSGSSPQGEEGTFPTCQRFVEHLNLSGSCWAPPTEIVDRQYIDAIADGTDAPPLKIQVVRALTDPKFWQSLGCNSNMAISVSVPEAADLLKSAIESKANKIPANIRSSITLVLDATDVPGLSLDPVVDEFNFRLGKWAISLGFESVWVVGPLRGMVRKLCSVND